MKNKGRSDGTINNYRDHIERLLADWLDEPLSKLGYDPSLVTAWHEKLTRENRAYIANGCMRTLRAVYNHARRAGRTLPADNPVSAIHKSPNRPGTVNHAANNRASTSSTAC